MNELATVLCLCPSSRLSLTSLVLSTWSGVRRYILTEDEALLDDVADVSAVLVMDRFVTRAIVEPLARKLPVIVLAWNGQFEIDHYRAQLRELDIIYMGTDEALASVPRYMPMINGDCQYAQWLELYRNKTQFVARGDASYRARWMRTWLARARTVNVLLASVGALARPHAFTKTLASSVINDKVVWAGNCYLDFAALGLTTVEEKNLEARITAIRAKPPEERLHQSLALIGEWHALAASTPAHQRFYVANTLLRWAVLSFLKATTPSSTWFFGRDNLGLGLEFELYVHNLVPAARIAFLEFGGKTSESLLYPRSLHLLSRQLYVIAIGDDALSTVERVRKGLSSPRDFFTDVERRRRELYRSLPANSTLRHVQQRVWSDF